MRLTEQRQRERETDPTDFDLKIKITSIDSKFMSCLRGYQVECLNCKYVISM